jgi:hypothetical protein
MPTARLIGQERKGLGGCGREGGGNGWEDIFRDLEKSRLSERERVGEEGVCIRK